MAMGRCPPGTGRRKRATGAMGAAAKAMGAMGAAAKARAARMERARAPVKAARAPFPPQRRAAGARLQPAWEQNSNERSFYERVNACSHSAPANRDSDRGVAPYF